MVVLNKIYTRTGDDGTTALGTGARVRKTAARIEAYGTVDETNAAIGLARGLLAALPSGPEPELMIARLMRVQNDLFDLGADLCVPESVQTDDAGASVPAGRSALRIRASQVGRLESEIDEMNAELAPLRSFVLPGAGPAAAQLHVARTVCRRAERCMLRLAAEPGERVGAEALKYINRLSDFLFVASRYVNDRGQADVLWVPGGTS
ncbi:MAG: cob(I)yrinic acid a,c-diamide adenosyltransferase [Hyphomicrobiaceae bacterium]